MTLDEIKQKMHEAVDKAWEALHGTHDLDKAREEAQATTAELQAQALQVEAHLVNHVADNAKAKAETAKSAPAEETGGETPAETGAASKAEEAPADKAAAASGKKTAK